MRKSIKIAQPTDRCASDITINVYPFHGKWRETFHDSSYERVLEL